MGGRRGQEEDLGRREAHREEDRRDGRGEALGHREEALAWEVSCLDEGREGGRRDDRVGVL